MGLSAMSVKHAQERGSLWVRYLGSKMVHCAETFIIPTDQVPAKVKKLVARGDVAAVWYVPGLAFSKTAHREYPP